MATFRFLPEEYKREVLRTYRKKLATIGFLLLSVSATVGVALAVPSYLVASIRKNIATTEKNIVEDRLRQKESAATEAKVKEVQASIEVLKSKSSKPLVATEIEKILVRKGEGISITGIVVTRTGKADQVAIEGNANTRTNLVDFSRRLEGEPTFEKVELPISSLAKNVDIEFSIIISMKP